MEDQIDAKTKKERSAELARISDASTLEFLKSAIGSSRKVLFEEYHGESGMVSGYSDNYIKVYCPVCDEEQSQELLNTLREVVFTEVHLDGVKGRAV